MQHVGPLKCENAFPKYSDVLCYYLEENNYGATALVTELQPKKKSIQLCEGDMKLARVHASCRFTMLERGQVIWSA